MGKTPTNKAGDMNNEIRFLIRNAPIAPDGLLVTRGDSTIFTLGEPRENNSPTQCCSRDIISHA